MSRPPPPRALDRLERAVEIALEHGADDVLLRPVVVLEMADTRSRRARRSCASRASAYPSSIRIAVAASRIASAPRGPWRARRCRHDGGGPAPVAARRQGDGLPTGERRPLGCSRRDVPARLRRHVRPRHDPERRIDARRRAGDPDGVRASQAFRRRRADRRGPTARNGGSAHRQESAGRRRASCKNPRRDSGVAVMGRGIGTRCVVQDSGDVGQLTDNVNAPLRRVGDAPRRPR